MVFLMGFAAQVLGLLDKKHSWLYIFMIVKAYCQQQKNDPLSY